MLQGRPAKFYGGRPTTMMRAYPVTLARRAIVVTMDVTAANVHLLRTNRRLKDPRNILLVWLEEPAYVGGVAEISPARDAMLTWSVSEVAAFLQSRDAGGLAQALQQNAVNGADLLGRGSYQEAAKDLNLTTLRCSQVAVSEGRFPCSGGADCGVVASKHTLMRIHASRDVVRELLPNLTRLGSITSYDFKTTIWTRTPLLGACL